MNEKNIRVLVESGVVKQVMIRSTGARFHVEFKVGTQTHVSQTLTGEIKTWASIDSAAKWLKRLGIGAAKVDFVHWQPHQRSF